MGQYHIIINLDKQQYLYPHQLGDGLKLREFGCSSHGTMTALAALLAEDNGQGLGDFHSDHPLIGSWARDRIAIVGDYGDGEPNLWDIAHDTYTDISAEIREALAAEVDFGPPW